MSNIKIGSNIASLRTQRVLNDSSAMLERISERLSTGLRINRASDDAAGLAIAQSLNTDARIYSVGIRNLSDGLSMLSIAEGALEQLGNIVTRQIELATQAANGTYSQKQRLALQRETTALNQEFNRIVATTTFNNTQLFSSSAGSITLQAGYGTEESISVDIAGAFLTESGSATFGALQNAGAITSSERVVSADFNGDGFLDLLSSQASGGGAITVFLNDGDGTFTAQAPIAPGSATPYDFVVDDFNNDGIWDFAAGHGATNQTVYLGNGNGTFSSPSFITLGGSTTVHDLDSADINNDGLEDLLFTDRANNRVYISLGNANGTFGSAYALNSSTTLRAFALGDINNDGNIDIVNSNVSGAATIEILYGNGDGTFAASSMLSGVAVNTFDITLADINFDGNLDLAYGSNSAYIRLGNGDGTFSAQTTYSLAGATAIEMIDLQDINGDGIKDLIASQQSATDRISYRLGNADGTFGSLLELSPGDNPIGFVVADFNNDLVNDLVTTVRQGGMLALYTQQQGALPQQELVNVMTQEGAQDAISSLREDLQQVTRALGVLGSYASRLEIARSHLGSLVENYHGAESRIKDADIAVESAEYTRLLIRQQISSAVLAQANSEPSLILKLLN